MNEDNYYDILKNLFYAGVRAVDPYELIQTHLRLEKNTLILQRQHDLTLINLDKFDEILVIGAGKASEQMAAGIHNIFGDKISDGLVVTKYVRYPLIGAIHILDAGHPLPDKWSVECGIALQVKAHRANEKTLFISLISGGASALVEVPRIDKVGTIEIALTLEDIITTNDILIRSGASIDEINCVRKHISMIKGGYLSAWMYPATALNFILSDDEFDRIEVIGSGLTTYDETSFEDAFRIIEKYDLIESIPEKVMSILQWGVDEKILETPKTSTLVFDKTENVIIGNNVSALKAIEISAQSLGFNVERSTDWMKGEAQEAGRRLFHKALQLKKEKSADKPFVFICGGETTVTIRGEGKGGRNQEIALAFLDEMKRFGAQAEGIYFLSAGTDGDDGPTDAAGAFTSYEIMQTAKMMELPMDDYLSRNDSYAFFDACGYLFKSGVTGTNVCDVQLILIK
jgi:glycerate-2-kinase